ncbi:MAG: DUF4405 domain-containing protein [Bacteroidales bacterium]|nr:DUF4405 domain-containing protein [Bacteroidales bacterium]
MKPINWKRLIRRISTLLLILTVVAQATTLILFETTNNEHEIEELHETLGYVFFGLILVHIILFRKSLKSLVSLKNK